MLRTLAALGLLLHLSLVPVLAQEVEELLASPEPNFRIEAANRLAAQGTRKSIEMLVRALQIEQDGATGRSMGAALKLATAPEAVQAVERAIAGPRKPGDFFAAVWALSGVAVGASEPGDAALQSLLKKGHNSEVSLRACALEAIGDSGRPELVEWLLPMLREATPAIDKANVFETLSLLAAARRLGEGLSEDKRKPLLEALIHVLDQAKDERLDYFAALALARITGQQPYVDANWWRNFLLNGPPAEAESDGKTVAKPTFFNAVAVGTRVLYVIDISGSMDWPAGLEVRRRGPTTGRAGDKPAGPDYSGVRTKLDLAKVELAWSLANLPANIHFNVIVYEAKHRLIDEEVTGMVPASEANKAKFTALVKSLRAGGGTNIHGSLTRALRITRKADVTGDPALDKRAMLDGADTIFFLTDGTPSWSDDSTAIAEVHPRWGGIGNGKFVKADAILGDIARVNTFRKVVIHTIGIGEDHDKGLMQKLADQNHGEYVGRG